jgi:chitinase
VRSLTVLTNQQQSPGNPTASAARSYSLAAGGGGGGTPTVSIADTSVAEGNAGTTPMTFTATLSAPAAGTVTVAFATATGKNTGTATQGTDFTASSGTFTFAPGATTATGTVNVIGDTTNEANETLTVRLSAPSGATIADDTAIGTITNDDGGGGGSAVVRIGDASVVEGLKGARSMTFTVSIPSAVASPVAVTATTSNGTAVAPGDYTARTAVVTIPAGSTSTTFLVSVKGDGIDEPNETFNVTLSSPSGGTIGDGTGVGTITDDD